MVATTAQITAGGNATPAIVTRGSTALVPSPSREPAALPRPRTGKLSLDELAAKVERYPEPIRTETRFAQEFLVGSCNSSIDMLRELAGERLKFRRSFSYFSNWINGAYFKPGSTGDVGEQGKGDWLNFCELLREHDDRTSAIAKQGTVVTGTVRAIEAYVTERMTARFTDRIGIVIGMTGSQKGAALKFIAASLKFPRGVYVECSARDSLVSFQRKLARRYNAKIKNSAAAREEAIADCLIEGRALFVGNIQRAFVTGRTLHPIIEWLLEVQEENKFTLILDLKLDDQLALYLMREKVAGADKDRAVDETLDDEAENVEKGGELEQLVGRCGGPSEMLVLPPFTPVRDLRTIAEAFKLPDSPRTIELLKAWSRQPGRIRVLFKKLERLQDNLAADGRDRILLADLEDVDGYTPPRAIEDNLPQVKRLTGGAA